MSVYKKHIAVYSTATVDQRINVSLDANDQVCAIAMGKDTTHCLFISFAPLSECSVNDEAGGLRIGRTFIDITPEAAAMLAREIGMRIFNIDD